MMGRDDVLAAAERIRGQVIRTPVARSDAFDMKAGPSVYFKCENLQHIGAFKARGAANAIARLSPEDRARGVITYSSGNHAQAVALAAMRKDIRADIVMPTDAPRVKREVVEELGATIHYAGTTSPERQAAALELAERTGAVIIEPFDHPDIIAGQGTATLELLDDAGDPLDAIVVPVGGGGLIAGACLACEGTDTAVFGVEPVGCDAMGQSLAAGERVTVHPGPTIADGLKPSRVGELNFAIARERVEACVTVDDREIGEALVRLLMTAKLLVEPSAAAAVAAVVEGRLPWQPRRVGVLLSGGNVAPHTVAQLIDDYP